MDKVALMIKARRLVKDVDDLPAIPAIVSKVVSLLDSEDADPDTIADLILSDQVLASRVIKVVNSPMYHSSSEITSVKRALLYLGFKSVREMILTSYFIGAFKDRDEPFDMEIFWMHSFSVGAISQRIAGMVGYRDTEKAHLVGIIHDIGKVFLGHYLRDQYAEMLESISGTSYTTYEAEHEYFGTTHCEVGLCLAQKWNFPPVYCDIISYHHTSEMATEDPMLASIVSLADFFCLSLGASSGIAQATQPGRSENNAWSVLKQLSTRPLPDTFGGFTENLAAEFGDAAIEVKNIFSTLAE